MKWKIFVEMLYYYYYLFDLNKTNTTKNTEQSKQLEIPDTNDIQAQNTQQHYYY